MGMAVIFGALALVVLAGAVLLWQVSQTGAQRAAGTAFIDSRLEAQASSQGRKATVAPRSANRAFRVGYFDEMFLRAGVEPTQGFYLRNVGFVVGLAVLASLFGGWLGAVLGALLGLIGVYFRLWWKADRRQQRMVTQLPVFLDAVVRLITIGSSLGAAFQTAASSVEAPLREVVERAASQNRSGKDLDQALTQVARLYGLKELQLVSAVVAVTLRYGGRSDQVLDRMSSFIRDLEAARQELTALSAEVRLSAWILSLLPIVLACYIVIFNAPMFLSMWSDPVGFKMLLVAAGLEIVGAYSLYRMAKSI